MTKDQVATAQQVVKERGSQTAARRERQEKSEKQERPDAARGQPRISRAELQKLPTPMRRQGSKGSAAPTSTLAAEAARPVAEPTAVPWALSGPWAEDGGMGGRSSGYREQLQARGQRALERSFVTRFGGSTTPAASEPSMYHMMATGSFEGSAACLATSVEDSQALPAQAGGQQPVPLDLAAALASGERTPVQAMQQPWAQQPQQQQQWQQMMAPANQMAPMSMAGPGMWVENPEMNNMQPQQSWDMQQMNAFAPSFSNLSNGQQWPQGEMVMTMVPTPPQMDPEMIAEQLRAAAPETYED